MLLYTKIRSQVETLEKLKEPLPVSYNMSFAMTYLGSVTDMFPVELKASKKEMGWLYGKASILIFKHDDKLYEIWLSELKNHAEDIFSLKVFNPEPREGCLQKLKETGAITGWLRVSDVVSRSKHIQEG